MSGFFRSALNIFQEQTRADGTALSHPLVGTVVEVGGVKVKLRRLLAEGGFGLVFTAQDNQGTWYALKRLIAHDKASADAAIQEIRFQTELSDHPNIVHFVSAETKTPQASRGQTEYYMLTELCGGGGLIDILQQGPLSFENVFKIFYAACQAIQFMHDRQHPITHRDMKIENLLFTSDGRVKLCDFGSATLEIYRPDETWSANKRSLLEEEMQKYTTPMYRAPEILETYFNYPIGPSQDIWALGCVLYYLCYRTHPFIDSSKLAIVNAKYPLKDEQAGIYAPFTPLIRSILQPNPHLRPSVQEINSQLENMAYEKRIDLLAPVDGVIFATDIETSQSPPRADASKAAEEAYNQAGEVFAQLKGQGMSLFKNLKEKSSAMVQQVQTYTDSGRASGSGHSSGVQTPSEPRAPPKVPTQPKSRLPGGPSLEDPFTSSGTVSNNEGFADFFSTLDWSTGQAQQSARQNVEVPVAQPARPPPPTQRRVPSPPNDPFVDEAVKWERQAGIRVQDEPEDEDAHLYKFDYEKPKPAPVVPEQTQSRPVEELDVLINDIDSFLDISSSGAAPPRPPAPQQAKPPVPPHQQKHNNDFLDDIFSSSSGSATSNPMHRNVSAPVLPEPQRAKNNDLFADFFKPMPQSENVSGRSTPSANPVAGIADLISSQGPQHRPKPASSNFKTDDFFGDLLANHGISDKKKATMGDMLRTEEEKFLDPVQIKIRNWTTNKNGNIRALLSSLDEVLWPEAGSWKVPSIDQMLNDAVVKKVYYKACLLVHPDKQVGQPHWPLAQAIFTELNKAMIDFENEKKS